MSDESSSSMVYYILLYHKDAGFPQFVLGTQTCTNVVVRSHWFLVWSLQVSMSEGSF